MKMSQAVPLLESCTILDSCHFSPKGLIYGFKSTFRTLGIEYALHISPRSTSPNGAKMMAEKSIRALIARDAR